KIGEVGHGVPTKTGFCPQFCGSSQPIHDNGLVRHNAWRVEINQTNNALVCSELSDRLKPRLHFGIGKAVRLHFFKGGSAIQMKDGKFPHDLALADSITITLGRSHSRIAGEVVGDKAVLFEPLRDPRWLIAHGSGVLKYLLTTDMLESSLVHRQQRFHICGVVGLNVGSEVVVDPSTVTSDLIA